MDNVGGIGHGSGSADQSGDAAKTQSKLKSNFSTEGVGEKKNRINEIIRETMRNIGACYSNKSFTYYEADMTDEEDDSTSAAEGISAATTSMMDYVQGLNQSDSNALFDQISAANMPRSAHHVTDNMTKLEELFDGIVNLRTPNVGQGQEAISNLVKVGTLAFYRWFHPSPPEQGG